MKKKNDKIKFMQEKDICVQRRTTGEKNVPENDDWWPGQYVRDRSGDNCLSRYRTTTTGIRKKEHCGCWPWTNLSWQYAIFHIIGQRWQRQYGEPILPWQCVTDKCTGTDATPCPSCWSATWPASPSGRGTTWLIVSLFVRLIMCLFHCVFVCLFFLL